MAERIGSGDVAGGLGEAVTAVSPLAALRGVRAANVPGRLRTSATRQYGQAFGATTRANEEPSSARDARTH